MKLAVFPAQLLASKGSASSSLPVGRPETRSISFVMRGFKVFLTIAVAGVLASCQDVNPQVQRWGNRMPQALTQVTPVQLYNEANVRMTLIPKGTVGRKYYRPMTPRYITIHNTENTSTGADAMRHALALKRGALKSRMRPGGNRIGFLTWHFTVDESIAAQHLPTREQGEHADFDGPGNNYSIGIEMCENRGNDAAQTIDRTAKLAAYLMYVYHIPVDNVVPHYHWRRVGSSPEHKPCPHWLLDNGKPGATWRWFQGRVQAHFNRIVPGPVAGI